MSDSILSTNHKERERQIKNISRVARGDKVEKKIYVQMEDLDEKKKRQEQVAKERQESGKVLNEIRSSKLKREESSTGKIYFEGTKIDRRKLNRKFKRKARASRR